MDNLDDVVNAFNGAVSSLIGLLEKKNRHDVDIKRVKDRLITVKQYDRETPIRLSFAYMLKYSEVILNRDEEFFFNTDVASVENLPSDSKEILEVISKVRSFYKGLSAPERDYIYEKTKTMLAASAGYARIIGYFSK